MAGFHRNHLRPHITLSVVLVAMTLAACGTTNDSGPTATTSAAPAQSSPLEARLLPVVTEQMEKMKIPGLIVYVQTACSAWSADDHRWNLPW